jgi:uncharacterized protein YbbK (DUF523 family)
MKIERVNILIIVSACLCGINSRYDGKNNLNNKVLRLLEEGKAILVCPEQLGGLSTPRPPHEIENGTGEDVLDGTSRVVSKDKIDSTESFIKGAQEALQIAKSAGVKYAILKSKSPSCGKGIIYDGSFSGAKIQGNGVTAELLHRANIEVFTEEEFEKLDIDNFLK